jgi:hypothetical protein
MSTQVNLNTKQSTSELDDHQLRLNNAQSLRTEFLSLSAEQFVAMLNPNLFREWHILTYYYLRQTPIPENQSAYFDSCVKLFERAKIQPGHGEMLNQRKNRDVIHGGSIHMKDENGIWSCRKYNYDYTTGEETYYWE